MYHQYRLFTKLYYDYLYQFMVLTHKDEDNFEKKVFLDKMLDSIHACRKTLARTAVVLNEDMSKYYEADAYFSAQYKEKLDILKIVLP